LARILGSEPQVPIWKVDDKPGRFRATYSEVVPSRGTSEADTWLGPVDSLDHATRKWPQEGFTRPWPGVLEIPAEIKRRVDQLGK
jgi:hypothetical protein